jgi:hypothetical protein
MKMAQTLNAFDISFRAYSFAQPRLCLRRSLKRFVKSKLSTLASTADYHSMKSDGVDSANERETNRTRPLSSILKGLTEKWGSADAYA